MRNNFFFTDIASFSRWAVPCLEDAIHLIPLNLQGKVIPKSKKPKKKDFVPDFDLGH
jgi:hypothetical protein